MSARAQVRQEGQGLDPVLVCAGRRSAAQPWRWHNANNMCTTRDINRATASGEVRMTKVCAHPTPGPRKAGPSLDDGVLSVWVSTASRNLACARRDKARHDCKAKERARRRRQRHLQNDRLGSMAGSQATAGLRGGAMRDSGHHTISELTRLGPASARRPGPQQGEGVSHLAFCTRRRRRRGGEQRNGLEQRKQGARSMASAATSPRCCSPAPGRSGELGEDGCRRSDVVKGR
jgi:hypothetical protein